MNEDFGTPIDAVLETLGLKRRIAMATPFFLSVPHMVLGTLMIAVVGEDLLDILPDRDMMARYEIPVAIAPVVSN